MSIRPVVLGGMIQRADDVGQVKIHEDHKPLVDQQMIQVEEAKKEQELSRQVIESNKSSELKNDLDAKQQGKGQYSSKKKRGKAKGEDVRVTKKQTSGFDIKI